MGFRKFFLVVCIFVAAKPVHAADLFFKIVESQPWRVIHESRYTGESGVAAQDGDFSIGMTSLNLQKEFKLENGLPVDLGFSVRQYWLNDGTAVDLPSSLQSKGARIGVKMPMPFTSDPRLFFGMDMGAYFQTAKEHSLHSSGFRFKSRVYGILKKSNDLIFAAGVMIRPDYEERPVLPFVGFQYLMNDHWSFHFLSDEPSVVYHINPKTRIRMQFGGYRDEFEVMSGGRKGDIVNIKELHAGLGFEYAVTERVLAQVTVGWAFGRKYEYLKEEAKVVPDDELFFGYIIRSEF